MYYLRIEFINNNPQIKERIAKFISTDKDFVTCLQLIYIISYLPRRRGISLLTTPLFIMERIGRDRIIASMLPQYIFTL